MYAYQKAMQILMSTFRALVLRDVAPVGIFEVFRSQTSSDLAVAQWLRFCATNRKVAGSIPAGVIGIFY